jgi:hypothetical protein
MFSIDIDQREYWITAKHVLTGAKHPPYGSVADKSVTLLILNPDPEGKTFTSIEFSVIDPGKDIDIVVLAAPTPLMSTPGTVAPPFEDTGTTWTLGGDCEFLGYPSAVGGAWRADIAGHRRWMPFIKHCTISAGTSDDVKTLFLDGINNEGFSGGPVIWQTGPQQKILGVISGFYPDAADVVELIQAKGANGLAIPPTEQPKQPPEVAKVNSGFFIAITISYAVDAIRKRPIGPLRQAH